MNIYKSKTDYFVKNGYIEHFNPRQPSDRGYVNQKASVNIDKLRVLMSILKNSVCK